MLLLLIALLTGSVPTHAAEPAPLAIEVSGAYLPDRLTVRAGEPIHLVFTRTTWDGCTREVVFPSLGLRKELPTGQPTPVDLPPQPPGEIVFLCGMGMIRGTLVVEAP